MFIVVNAKFDQSVGPVNKRGASVTAATQVIYRQHCSL